MPPYRLFAAEPNQPPRAVGEPIESQFRAFREASSVSARNRRLHVDVRDEHGTVIWQSYHGRPLAPAAPPPADGPDPEAPFIRPSLRQRLFRPPAPRRRH